MEKNWEKNLSVYIKRTISPDGKFGNLAIQRRQKGFLNTMNSMPMQSDRDRKSVV